MSSLPILFSARPIGPIAGYNVYKNDGNGGPVDYSSPVAFATNLAYVGPVLAAPSDTTYAVRATDGTNEESNVDCRVRIVIDAAGHDVSARPNPPTMITAVPTSGGGARVDWLHVPTVNAPTPTAFHVWLTAGPTVDHAASPAATVAYTPRLARYSATLSGLSDGVAYSVGVRATNAAGDEQNTISARVTGASAAPIAVASLSGSATFTP